MTAGLELRDVALRLGDGDTSVLALDDVSLRVAAGELVAVIGPSGSGKSSLLAVAGALIRPTSGTVVVGEHDLSGLGDRERTRLRRERIGFVFQAANLLPSLSAREQLLLVRHLDGRITQEHRERADRLLDAVGMNHRAGRRPHQLSGGERQRVGIARALMTGPDVLLVDEPTSALDHQRAHEVVRLLAEETHQVGTATVMVTHDPAIVEHADRVVTMSDGRLDV
jgi:putative ABC transport system ATP-binding protein